MRYWHSKFKNISPFPLPLEMPNDALELAKMAIERITSVDRATKITVYDTETEVESEDKTWIVSGISPFQKEFLSNIPKVCMTVINLILYTVLCISIAQHLMGWKPG
jgi:signaling intermediate in Toll pathway protein